MSGGSLVGNICSRSGQLHRDRCSPPDRHHQAGRVHTLRHNFATYQLVDGVDIRMIQALLGQNKMENTAFQTRPAFLSVLTDWFQAAKNGEKTPAQINGLSPSFRTEFCIKIVLPGAGWRALTLNRFQLPAADA